MARSSKIELGPGSEPAEVDGDTSTPDAPAEPSARVEGFSVGDIDADEEVSVDDLLISDPDEDSSEILVEETEEEEEASSESLLVAEPATELSEASPAVEASPEPLASPSGGESPSSGGETVPEPPNEADAAAALVVETTPKESPMGGVGALAGQAGAAPSTAGPAPLPSFDIPESVRPRETMSGVGAISAEGVAKDFELAVVDEDEDDAVTQLGIQVSDDDAEPPRPALSSQSVTPSVGPVAATPSSSTGAASLRASRGASTLVLPRADVEAAYGGVVSGLASSDEPTIVGRSGSSDSMASPPNRSWPKALLDRYLPSVSLVLLGAGLGSFGLSMFMQRPGSTSRDQTVQALRAPAGGGSLVERAWLGDGSALREITETPAAQRTALMTLALEQGQWVGRHNESVDFAQSLASAPNTETTGIVDSFMRYAGDTEALVPAFERLLSWEGSRAPDLLYAIWEKAPVGSRAAALAPQLLYSADLRSRATAALSVALDLGAATTCEDYLRVLPRVVEHGDPRCAENLRSLEHTDGCGDDGKSDCYACLRPGTLLKDALKAIDQRAAPKW